MITYAGFSSFEDITQASEQLKAEADVSCPCEWMNPYELGVNDCRKIVGYRAVIVSVALKLNTSGETGR